MNIILEGGVNFYDELNKSDSDVDDEEEECCLITNYPLDKNSITLQCNHKFNLLPLYKEVCNQKCKASHLEIKKLKMNEIKCPYCRQRHNKLLPHVKLNNTMSYIHGVNSPEEYCMSLYSCEYTYKYGKNKGNTCSNNAYITVGGCYCNTHHKYMEKSSRLLDSIIKIIANRPSDVPMTQNATVPQIAPTADTPDSSELNPTDEETCHQHKKVKTDKNVVQDPHNTYLNSFSASSASPSAPQNPSKEEEEQPAPKRVKQK